MKFKIASHRLSYLASFSYFLFGCAALAHTNTLAPDSKIKILLLFLSGAYALFSAIALIHLLRPSRPGIEPQVLSLPVQRGIRVLALALPLPFMLLYGGVLGLSGIVCGAGFVGEVYELFGQYDLAKASYNKRLLLHRALDSKQMICDLAALGSICDKQHLYTEADEFYEEAERLTSLASIVKEDETSSARPYVPQPTFEAINAADWQEQPWSWRKNKNINDKSVVDVPFVTSTTVTMALPRILRLLNQIPEAKAKEQFEFASWALAHNGETSLMLGRHFGKIDLRPVIYDQRKPVTATPGGDLFDAEESHSHAPPVMSSSSGTIGPAGAYATTVIGISPAGHVLPIDQLRMMLRKIPRDVALKNFAFAEKFYPRAGDLLQRSGLASNYLSGTYLFPLMVCDMIPEQMTIMDDDQYGKLYRLGKSGDGALVKPEIDLVFEVDESHNKPKSEWIDWIKKRARESGFVAAITFERPKSELCTLLPGELRFSLAPQENRLRKSGYGNSLIPSNARDYDADTFAWLRSAFDEVLRDHAWVFYSKPNSSDKRTHLQLFIDSGSDPINLSDKERKQIIAKGRSLGYEVTIHNDRVEPGLFSREELENWGETVLVKIALHDGSFTTEINGRTAGGGVSSYPFPTNGLPGSHRYSFVEMFDQSIEFAAGTIKGKVELFSPL